MVSTNRPDPDDTETNFGWWTDKPERKSQWFNSTRTAALSRPRRIRRERVWLKSMLVVALMTAFVLALKSLFGW